MRLGVNGFFKELIGKVSLFELDTFDPVLKLKSFQKAAIHRQDYQIHLSANQYYYRPESPIPLLERVQILKEIYDQCAASECVIKLTPSFFDKHTLDEVIIPFGEEWIKSGGKKLFLDLPQKLPRSLKPNSHLIMDPLWHKVEAGHYWRIHGWNDARWVRRYSQADLADLAKRVVRHKPETLVFAHSQRAIQILEFIDILGIGLK